MPKFGGAASSLVMLHEVEASAKVITSTGEHHSAHPGVRRG